MQLIYKNEKMLFFTLLVISLLGWSALIVGTLGIALIYLFLFFIFYLFAHSAFISYLKGTGVKITSEQFPDLHEKIVACGEKLGLKDVPDAYLLHAGGVFNALATRFLGRNFIVLFSDIVDALEERPDSLNFYIGHEMGHIKRNHLRWAPILVPGMILPLVGAGYSRAREYTCDRHGLSVCADGASAQFGLAALAAGGKRWRTMNKDGYISQIRAETGFWMSLHELISDYPWLTKRMAALKALTAGQEVRQPTRNPLAWFFALFIPRFGMGGGAGSLVIMVAVIGILAAIAIPQYQEYLGRGKLNEVVSIGQQATVAVAEYYYANNAVPQTLDKAGFSLPAGVKSVQEITVDSKSGLVRITLAVAPYTGKSIVFVPSLDADNKRIVWHCSSNDIAPRSLPASCRDN